MYYFKKSLIKTLSYILLLLLSFAAIVACNSATTSSINDRPPLKFAHSFWPGVLPIAIAEDKGFFKQQGVKLQRIYLQDQDVAIQISDFVAGKYDGMILALGDVVTLVNANPSLLIVAAIDESKGADAIISSPQIKDVASLKGKIIGVKFGTFGELFVNRMLSLNGLTTNDVKYSNINADKIYEPLKKGEVQAGHSWEPYMSQLTKAGFHVLFTSAKTPGLIPDVIVFRGMVVRERPEDIKAFLRAWFQAVDYWLANPQEGNAIIAKVLKIKPEDISLEGLQLLTVKDNIKAFASGNTTESLAYTMKLYSDFAIQKGNLTRPPEIDKFLTPAFLPKP
ncbi:ABC transporter substrate-binding protein [Kamptonema sp. UHCC 0994]|uniref:ABC transporter substrate-binding protein n=1 Tax=Kamptonema sp. UHCC 0994 TaxID=3031329 RepID=UPI0023BA43C2|nr:ABC transporter substrate-binding protein [Kamptonema sp. UHCC 0994]MDF0556526.1 ABC transporter substrate-binding protein [Kamptonema sp. UHCC 0994]